MYQQLLVVATALAALAITHLLVFALWRRLWSDGQRPLPALLVFPRMEIILATTTIVGVSEAFGALVATHSIVPEAVSILGVLYLLLFVLTVAFLAYMLAKHSALLPDKSEVRWHAECRCESGRKNCRNGMPTTQLMSSSFSQLIV